MPAGKNSALQTTSTEAPFAEQSTATLTPFGTSSASATPTLTLTPTSAVLPVTGLERNCTYNSLYWAQHPEAWPVENIVVGKFSYTKQQVLDILNSEPRTTATHLTKQFLTSVLNLLTGVDSTSIDSTLDQASSWLDAHLLETETAQNVLQDGDNLTKGLQDYNNGSTGPGPCPDQPSTVVLLPAPTSVAIITTIPRVKVFLSTPVPAPTRRPRSGNTLPSNPTPQPPQPTNTPSQPQPTSPPPGPEPALPPTATNAPPPPKPTQAPPQPTQAPPQPTQAPAAPPTPTDAPKPTHDPKPTKEPKGTEVSAPTPAPQSSPPPPTAAPPATQAPQPTSAPEPTHEPKPTKKPK